MNEGTRPLRSMLLGAILALLVQFMLGMAVNLFVKIPDNHPGHNPAEYFSGVVQSVSWAVVQGPVLLILHTAFGLLLVVNALVIVLRGFRTGVRGLRAAVIVGGLGVLGAGFNGGSYLNYGQDASSMLMAAGFAVAVAGYLLALYLMPRAAPTEPA